MHNLFRGIVRDATIVVGIIAMVAGVISIFLVHVKNEFQISKIGYERAEITRVHRHLIEENRRLKVEAAMLLRTDRVIAKAKEEFNLFPAKATQIVVIDEEIEAIKTAMK